MRPRVMVPLGIALCWASVALAQVAPGHRQHATAPGPAPRDSELAGPLDRVTAERLALARNPGLRAARKRASATRLAGEAEGKLPPPEAEFQIWQVPLSRPYDVPGAQMIMLGLRQPIPAPGSLGAKAEAKERDADVELAMANERAREIVRDVDHAFVSYVEATRKHRIHADHQAVAEAIVRTAQARYPAGGALTDITQAEVEVAKIEADVAVEEANVSTARATLNGLVLRPADAPLGQPVERAATTIGESLPEIVARARALRPETRTANARTAAALAEARVAEREANGPMMSVGLLYFAPTTQTPSHGYGLSFSSTLPWLWGRARSAVRAQRELAGATTDDTADADARIATEVATAEGLVRAQARRLVVLERRSLPAAKRAFEAATSGYSSGRTDILVLLSARNSVVTTEVEIVGAKAALEHALVDLDWAAGAPVRRTPVPRGE